jgi:hypothetical protein
MDKLSGWNGPFFEEGDIFAVYIGQDRYWINIKNWNVMEAPNNPDRDDSFKNIEGQLADQLRAFVITRFMKEPKLAERKCRTMSIITTDTGDFVASDSLMRLFSNAMERIQAVKGKGEQREFKAGLQKIALVEIKGVKATYICSADFYDFFPDLREIILTAEKRLPL